MRRITLIIFASTLVFSSAAGQQKDTLIYAVGRIYNQETKEPVEAMIFYESMPYGNKAGSLSGSSFQFPLFDSDKYSIIVEAPGFARSKYLLDPATATDGKVVLDIALAFPKLTTEVETTGHVGKVIRLEALIFQQRSTIISPESYPELDKIASMLHTYPKMVIQLEGHTDTRGDAKMNFKLSQERVDAVRDYLLKKGVAKNKVKTKAFGGTMPLSRENTEEAHKLNRRVEVRIIEN